MSGLPAWSVTLIVHVAPASLNAWTIASPPLVTFVELPSLAPPLSETMLTASLQAADGLELGEVTGGGVGVRASVPEGAGVAAVSWVDDSS